MNDYEEPHMCMYVQDLLFMCSLRVNDGLLDVHVEASQRWKFTGHSCAANQTHPRLNLSDVTAVCLFFKPWQRQRQQCWFHIKSRMKKSERIWICPFPLRSTQMLCVCVHVFADSLLRFHLMCLNASLWCFRYVSVSSCKTGGLQMVAQMLIWGCQKVLCIV